MPSIRSLATNLTIFAIGTVRMVFGLSSPVERFSGSSISASVACQNPQLSCHNTTAVSNLCCFNAPGGSLLQTQFWDTSPAAGPSDSWTIHGLWPDNCDGTYSAFCDDTRAYTNISSILTAAGDTALLNYMKKYWASNSGYAESFWEHEWGKHGTCISTLEPDCYTSYQPTEEVPDYFRTAVDLFKTLPSYDWLKAAGIVPSTSKTYAASQMQAVLSKHHNGKQVYLGCNGDELDEIWYYFNVRGSIQTGQFVPANNDGSTSTCPDTGIKYLPKGSTGGTPTSTTATSAPTSTPTGPPFTGKGYLNIIPSDSNTANGCLISGGTWYTSGTCATFRIVDKVPQSPLDEEPKFSLRSSKGNCAVGSSGKLSCGSDIGTASTFSANGSSLMYKGSTSFWATEEPSGSEQGAVFVKKGGRSVELRVEWEAA